MFYFNVKRYILFRTGSERYFSPVSVGTFRSVVSKWKDIQGMRAILTSTKHVDAGIFDWNVTESHSFCQVTRLNMSSLWMNKLG